jgi:hypothetical protein
MKANKYSINCVIDVWKADGTMEQLVTHLGYADKESAIEGAKQLLKESRLDYVKAHINLMYYSYGLYNYKTEDIWV